MKKKYLLLTALIGCAIFMLFNLNTATAVTSNSEISGTLPSQNKNIDDRVRLIYGYQIKQDLVKVNHANTLYNLSILGDKDNFIFFCLNERKYNPTDGEVNILQPNGQLAPEINWLSSNFYSNIDSFKLTENTPSKTGGNSPVSSFNKANFYNKYVYTQLAIWHFTNPGYFAMSMDVIKDNPEVVALINEANKHKNFYNPTYNQALSAINDIHYEATDLVKESENSDTYIFSTTVTKSGSNELFDVKDVLYKVSLTENNQTQDITKQVTVTPATKNKVYIQVPKALLNESQAKLTVSATANITSEQSFTTYYDNNNNKQPVLSAYQLSKKLSTEKAIDITNQTQFTVYKKWDDQKNQDGKRPFNINVQLYADGQALGNSVVLNTENNWQYTWTDLDAKANGKEIEYSVKEVAVSEGYTPTITTDKNDSSATITNSYTPEVTSLTGEKIWNDQNDQDGKRPASIIVNLLANGSEIDQQTVTPNQNGDWTYQFTNLPVYQNGQKIAYTVTEDTVPDYSTEINGTTITNSYTPGKTSVAISKSWDDQNNQDNLRPKSIQVQLYEQTVQGKTAVGEAITLSEENQWSNLWSDLPLMNQGEPIKYTVEEVNQSANIPGYTTTIDDIDHGNIIITNKHEVELTTISGLKSWNDSNNQDGLRPDSLTVILYADGEEVNRQIVTAANNWSYQFNDLPVYAKGEKIDYTIGEVAVPGYTLAIDGFNISNTHVPETTEITGVKTWYDKNNQDGLRPDNLTVILYANGTEVARQAITAANDWVYNFTDLPKNENGKEIDYTIGEITVPGYDVTPNDGNLLNTHQVEKTTVSGVKNWDDNDNQDGKRPEFIVVYLYADGELVKQQEVTPNDQGNWYYEFTDLDKKKEGKEINYTVMEELVPYYDTEINGTNLTNHYTTETTDIKGIKNWDDSDDQDGLRPKSITVHLIADGNTEEPVATQMVDESTNWVYEFVGVPVYKNGQKINYTIKEDKVFNYTTKIDGFDITNSYTPNQTSVSVKKIWNDDQNQDGLRPLSISVQLLANGKEKGEPVLLTEATNWTYEWTNLPEKEKGKVIKYEVKENTVDGYEGQIDETNPNDIIITNTHLSEKTQVTGTKKWEDQNNQDGKRPESITVNLLADGVKVNSQQVTAENNWTYTFTDLPVFKEGQKIIYTVTEDHVAEYSRVPMNDHSYDLTNSYTPGKTSVTVTKSWEDENNQDGLRPDSIDVQLYGNDQAVGDVQTLNNKNNWQYTWTDLNEKENGQTIAYTIKEVNSPASYEVKIDDQNSGNIMLTNSYKPEMTEIAGTKTWIDDDNKLGKRPETITVNLLANGEKIDSQTVSNKTNWKYVFTDLPKYENGQEISYTITETPVTDYTTEIKGYDLINTYNPKKTSATVVKKWVDNNDVLKKRPDTVTVQLYANGKKQGTEVSLNVQNNWSYTWDNLDKEDKKGEIEYTVIETSQTTGYTPSISKDKDGLFTVTNTYTNDSTITDPNTTNTNYPTTGEKQTKGIMILGTLFISLATILFIARKKQWK